MNYVIELITILLIDSLLYKNLLIRCSDSLINLVVSNRSVGLSVVYLWASLSVWLVVCRCLRLSVYLCICVCASICVFCLSVCLSVVCLAVGRSISLPFSRSVCLWSNLSMCLFACLWLSISVCLSAFLSLCLSACLLSVGRSVGHQCSLPEPSVSHSTVTVCTKRASSGGQDAESESGTLLTQERQVGLMNVELRTGDGSKKSRARSRERRRLYIRANNQS